MDMVTQILYVLFGNKTTNTLVKICLCLAECLGIIGQHYAMDKDLWLLKT